MALWSGDWLPFRSLVAARGLLSRQAPVRSCLDRIDAETKWAQAQWTTRDQQGLATDWQGLSRTSNVLLSMTINAFAAKKSAQNLDFDKSLQNRLFNTYFNPVTYPSE